MQNFVIMDMYANLSKPRPEYDNKQFVSLKEYLKLSEVTIKYFAPKLSRLPIHTFTESEDIIGYVAYEIMMADWLFDKDCGMTLPSYRLARAKWAILNVMGAWRTRKNRQVFSLDFPNIDHCTKTLGDTISSEHSDVDNYDVRDLVENANLTDWERKCVQLFYFEKESMADIAKEHDCSRQNIQCALKKASKRLAKELT